ncbi:hypothetical protein, partial [Streptomyces sp. NPDC047028]|uniref:hypothetical protein n=1 Tax=Streptomyces sp. NPDC047028 TaxID=3155793 RepID=UPI0033F188AA
MLTVALLISGISPYAFRCSSRWPAPVSPGRRSSFRRRGTRTRPAARLAQLGQLQTAINEIITALQADATGAI